MTYVSVMIPIAFAEDYFLGGARDAVVQVCSENNTIKCHVSFFPVQVFDKTTNMEINRGKADFYCQQALSKWKKVPNGGTLSISGLTILGKPSEENGRYFIIYEVPQDSIRIGLPIDTGKHTEARGSPTPVSLEPKAKEFHGGLLERVSDHKDTIAHVVRKLLRSIHLPADGNKDYAVADLEQQIRDSLETCRREMISDGLLLKIEKDDISIYIDRQMSMLIDKLRFLYREQQDYHK